MALDIPRLDILLYAHDGRGLGHVSRSAAIGMAVRRLYPELKICLMTGCRQTQELIGTAPLDWLKLPAYETEVVDGKSRGVDGLSGYTDRDLGLIRSQSIKQIVCSYQPRLILVDHSPQGKHKELVPALESSEQMGDIRWLLGVRGVVGSVLQTESSLARELYERHYSKLLWYGDSRVLGDIHCDSLGSRFNTVVEECGYVSRLTELERITSQSNGHEILDCTVSIPWFDEHTPGFLEILVRAIQRMAPVAGTFRFFVGDGAPESTLRLLAAQDNFTVDPFGEAYTRVLRSSRTAVIFGGYNSLVDTLATGVPALVVLRDMRDNEQQQHLDALVRVVPDTLEVVPESGCDEVLLSDKLAFLMSQKTQGRHPCPVNLEGAQAAAHILANSI